jgi:GR25 family glycosyltransferase involved in LPS biosynthesis
MHLNPLILEGKLIGYEELARGEPMKAIDYIQFLVEKFSADEATSRAAYRYMLLYATYSFPHLSLKKVIELCRAYRWAIDDQGTQNLIAERLNARFRLERTLQTSNNLSADSHHSASAFSGMERNGIRVYCNSIPKRTDNQQRMQESARRANLGSLLFYGVEASSLASKPDFIRFAATPVTSAILMSHRDIWQHIVSNRVPAAIVLEDDVEIMGPFQLDLSEEVRDGADLIFLNNRVLPNYELQSELSIDDPSTSIVSISYGCGADGYLVTARGASKLLELFQVAVAPVDVQIMSHSDLFAESNEEMIECRQTRKSDIQLTCRRLYPFLVEHPAIGFSTVVSGLQRNFCPGLWGGDVRL